MLHNSKTVQWIIVIGIIAGMLAWTVLGMMLYGGYWS